MIQLIVESEKAVSRQLHGERRAEAVTTIAPKQQGMAWVTPRFVSVLPNFMQHASVNQPQIYALPCQRMHRVRGVTDDDKALGNRVGDAHEVEWKLLGGADHVRHAYCAL